MSSGCQSPFQIPTIRKSPVSPWVAVWFHIACCMKFLQIMLVLVLAYFAITRRFNLITTRRSCSLKSVGTNLSIFFRTGIIHEGHDQGIPSREPAPAMRVRLPASTALQCAVSRAPLLRYHASSRMDFLGRRWRNPGERKKLAGYWGAKRARLLFRLPRTVNQPSGVSSGSIRHFDFSFIRLVLWCLQVCFRIAAAFIMLLFCHSIWRQLRDKGWLTGSAPSKSPSRTTTLLRYLAGGKYHTSYSSGADGR